jgi:NADPH2 dehydrogenase
MYKAGENGCLTPFHHSHYGARAIGGVGLIIVEATAIEPRGRITDNDLGLWSDAQIQEHQKLVQTCHDLGARMAIQLAHAGRKSICKESIPVAPSPLLFSDTGGFKTPIALCNMEIEEIIIAFVEAAKRAYKAGYDALELHAAHGYLLGEFLSPLTNVRTDRYGGSLENRCKLAIKVCDAIMKAVPLPLIVRLSADEWMEGGWNINDSVYLSQQLHAIGVSMMHISAGGNHAKQTHIPPLVPSYQTDYAKSVKEKSTMPTIAVGLITTHEQGITLLQEGVCDLVAYGRELLRNPNMVQFFMKETGEKKEIEIAYARAF